MASFEFYWGGVPGSAVAPLGVVEHLDVVEDVGSCVIARRVYLTADAFTLEQLEEALYPAGNPVLMLNRPPSEIASTKPTCT